MKSLRTQERRLLLDLLREARQAAGLRQVNLAARMGVPQSLISKVEVGQRRLDVLELRAICEALGLSLGEFVEHFEKRLHTAG